MAAENFKHVVLLNVTEIISKFDNAAHMQRIAHKLDAFGLSRLAWLFLLEENVAKAREYANKGCAIDTTNRHCLKILERLDGQTGGAIEE
jgi:hypothetical protein